MPRGGKERPIDYAALHARYVAGESGMAVAESAGIKWSGLYRAWQRLGLPRRTASQAAQLLFEQQPERARLIEHATAKRRGGHDTLATVEQRARTREARGLGISAAENVLAGRLRALGFTVRQQMAIGRYNVDIAIAERQIVVEVDGGGHSFRSRDNAEERRAYIEAQGWTVIHVWAKARTLDWLERALEKFHSAAA